MTAWAAEFEKTLNDDDRAGSGLYDAEIDPSTQVFEVGAYGLKAGETMTVTASFAQVSGSEEGTVEHVEIYVFDQLIGEWDGTEGPAGSVSFEVPVSGTFAATSAIAPPVRIEATGEVTTPSGNYANREGELVWDVNDADPYNADHFVGVDGDLLQDTDVSTVFSTISTTFTCFDLGDVDTWSLDLDITLGSDSPTAMNLEWKLSTEGSWTLAGDDPSTLGMTFPLSWVSLPADTGVDVRWSATTYMTGAATATSVGGSPSESATVGSDDYGIHVRPI